MYLLKFENYDDIEDIVLSTSILALKKYIEDCMDLSESSLSYSEKENKIVVFENFKKKKNKKKEKIATIIELEVIHYKKGD